MALILSESLIKLKDAARPLSMRVSGRSRYGKSPKKDYPRGEKE
jgi:hypothetical protein